MEFGPWFPVGSKVRFLGKNGYDHDREYAATFGLVAGETYTVRDSETFSFSSEVELKEVPGVSFNTVMFEVVSPQEELAKLAYYKWEEAGRPDGQADEFWKEAKKEYYCF